MYPVQCTHFGRKTTCGLDKHYMYVFRTGKTSLLYLLRRRISDDIAAVKQRKRVHCWCCTDAPAGASMISQQDPPPHVPGGVLHVLADMKTWDLPTDVTATASVQQKGQLSRAHGHAPHRGSISSARRSKQVAKLVIKMSTSARTFCRTCQTESAHIFTSSLLLLIHLPS